jgi:hypothetical protein
MLVNAWQESSGSTGGLLRQKPPIIIVEWQTIGKQSRALVNVSDGQTHELDIQHGSNVGQQVWEIFLAVIIQDRVKSHTVRVSA